MSKARTNKSLWLAVEALSEIVYDEWPAHHRLADIASSLPNVTTAHVEALAYVQGLLDERREENIRPSKNDR